MIKKHTHWNHNTFTYFAKGNIALSITLTGCISMLSPFILPLLFINYVNVNSHTTHGAFLPLIPTIKQLIAAYYISGICGLIEPIRRTIAIEVGIQNAGTAMMVALTILQDPQIAFVPLMYGLLMNIPALFFILWVNKKHLP